jgi:hypothetical protein
MLRSGRGLVCEQELDAIHRGQGGVGLAAPEVGPSRWTASRIASAAETAGMLPTR